MNRPNIIFYFSDQQRADTAGCYGQKLPVTPNLDKIAEEGTLFENAFTCQPVCGPMRACLQSGTYATQNGCYRNDIALPPDTKTIAHYLKESGYDTAYVGKWHLASDSKHDLKTKPTPKERRGGYDFWRASDVLEFTSHGYNGYIFDENENRIDFKGYRADKINDYAIEYINKEHEKPFFMFVSQLEPHHQNDRLRFESPKGLKSKFKNYDIPGDLKGTLGDWRIQMPSYLACCNRVDHNFGRLIAALREKGLYNNTVIIYTSDHGCHFRTRNAEYKRSCHEASIKVPLVITGGGFKTGGKRVSDLVSLIDLPATILDIAGIPVPDHFMGKSLCDLKGRESVFMQISESQIGRAIRTDKWKYSVSSKNKDCAFAESYTEDFLYDLENDPYEKNNLISDPSYSSVKKELKAILLEYMTKCGEPNLTIITKGE